MSAIRIDISGLKFDEQGLIPAIVQHGDSGRVLMMAFMSRESLGKSLETGETWFFSRSRNELWHKGATSGNTQRIQSIHSDCDGDALLVKVEPAGPACHTGAASCFHHEVDKGTAEEPVFAEVVSELHQLIKARKRELPEGSYTTSLFEAGVLEIAKKVGEEGLESALAAVAQDRERQVEEISDLVYHLLVLMTAQDIPLGEIAAELGKRRK